MGRNSAGGVLSAVGRTAELAGVQGVDSGGVFRSGVDGVGDSGGGAKSVVVGGGSREGAVGGGGGGKVHLFRVKSYSVPVWCEVCQRLLFGVSLFSFFVVHRFNPGQKETH